MHQVYLIKNLVNGKLYVGKTERKLQARWKEHLSFARCGKGWAVSSAIRKYGEENFSVTTLAETNDVEELNRLEVLWIFLLDCRTTALGYNMTDGGDGVSGRIHSAETRQKISRKHKGKKYSSETIERMRKAQTGKKLSAETKAKIGAASKGHIKSAETRKKLSLANVGKPRPESAREKNRQANRLKSGPTASRFRHDISTDEICRLRQSGMSLRKIASHLGIDKSTVMDRLQKVGEKAT